MVCARASKIDDDIGHVRLWCDDVWVQTVGGEVGLDNGGRLASVAGWVR